MTVADLFENRDSDCVRLDWKGEMEDALFAMRNQWGQQYQFLHDTAFNDLAENYSGEVSEDQLLGLGQEMTTYGLALYHLEEDSDEYCLLLVSKDEMAEFEAYAKEHEICFAQLKQSRKKFGEAAKRIKLSGKLPHEAFELPKHSHLTYAGTVAVNKIRHYSEGAYTHSTCVLLDLSQWPPKEYPQTEIINDMAYSAKYKLWAAVTGDNDLQTALKISESPLDPMFWRDIPFCEEPDLYAREEDPSFKFYNADVLDTLSRLFWVGKDLLIAYPRRHKPGSIASVTHVWAVENAVKGGTECRKVLVTPPCHLARGEFPGMAQTQNGDIFLLFSGRFYTWNNGELTEVFEAQAHMDFHAMPTGPTRFAYVNDDGNLVETDADTGRTRLRTLDYLDYKTNVRLYNKKWAIFLRWGYTSSTLDIAQFWNVGDDNWLRLPLGALGKEGVKDVRLLPDNTTLLQTETKLCHTADLFAFLRKQRKKKPDVSTWSDNWNGEAVLKNDNGEAAGENEAIVPEKVAALSDSGGFFSKFLSLFRSKEELSATLETGPAKMEPAEPETETAMTVPVKMELAVNDVPETVQEQDESAGG